MGSAGGGSSGRRRSLRLDPDVAVLDALDELLRVEFAVVGGNREERGRRRALLDVGQRDGVAVNLLDAGHEIERDVDPAIAASALGRDGLVFDAVAPVEAIRPEAPAFLVGGTGNPRHGLPLAAGVA